jgi:enoyl-CoA hydratase/carnithine racemase
MTYQHLTSTRDGVVERLTLNRPDVRNAFNEHVIAELTEAFTEAADEFLVFVELQQLRLAGGHAMKDKNMPLRVDRHR